MNNILVNTIEKIQSLTKSDLITDKKGREYFRSNLKPATFADYPTLKTVTLKSIVDFIKNNYDKSLKSKDL